MVSNVRQVSRYEAEEASTDLQGGLPTTAEMCLAFLFYYPKTTISKCLSEPLFPQYGSDPFKNVDHIYSPRAVLHMIGRSKMNERLFITPSVRSIDAGVSRKGKKDGMST
jgi:hypothetical protein